MFKRRNLFYVAILVLGCFLLIVLNTYAVLELQREIPLVNTQDVTTLMEVETLVESDRAVHNSTLMYLRSKRIDKYCDHRVWMERMKSYKFKYKYLQSSNDNSLFYCPVPKAAWSTWKHLFYRNASIEHLMGDMKHTGFNSEWWKAGLTRVNNVTSAFLRLNKLVVVRDPYDRLVSSYKDKVLGADGSYVKSSHRPCKDVNKDSPGYPVISFSKFVDCIIGKAITGHSQLDEFGAGHSLDVHWKPQTLLCDFCSVRYNIIAHIETFDNDVGVALKRLNMDTTIVQENKTANKTQSLLREYYSQLTHEQMEKLHQLYLYDRVLLGYQKFTLT